MVVSVSSPEAVSSVRRVTAAKWLVLLGDSSRLLCSPKRSEKASALTCMFENVAEPDPNLKPA